MAGDTNALRYAGGHIGERLIVEIVILGCQRKSEGAGFERVPRQPWNKASLYLPIQNTSRVHVPPLILIL